ncbi:MAG: c-type cytochrome [Sulfobacillus sp.]
MNQSLVAKGSVIFLKAIKGLLIIVGSSLWLCACGASPKASQTPYLFAPAAAIAAGNALYQHTCAYCHGTNGQGGVRFNAPRLWGPGNVVQTGVFNSEDALAAFIKRAMPAQAVNGVNPGGLTEIQAHQVAQYILSKNRG